MLQIKYPQHRDIGVYECQVSTTPHMSHFIHLDVIGECVLMYNIVCLGYKVIRGTTIAYTWHAIEGVYAGTTRNDGS